MITYKPKKLIEGFRLGAEYHEKEFVALPDKKIKDTVEVVYKNKSMIITPSLQPVMVNEFEDKWGRGKYRLYYYEWRPTVQSLLF